MVSSGVCAVVEGVIKGRRYTPRVMEGNQDHSAWMRGLGGRFVVFDGPDGSGKSTQFHRFATAVRSAGVVVEETREPGGTSIGERIRDILLDPIHEEMGLRCEMMLYMASRAQLVEQKIRPSLDRGELVLADRYVSSTLAYQGAAGGLPRDEIMAVAKAACRDAWPDLVVIFDVDERTAAGRLNPLLDRMEQKGAEFHAKVRAGYLDQARADPDGYVVVDASADPDTVFQSMLDRVRERLG
ncbi:MAG: dTMP kinase [Phycisphaeraceae bacterium]|nr:MAG: dTMP kinase [Phycisphaeraceae bacterium]